jgi:hypothetical protein
MAPRRRVRDGGDGVPVNRRQEWRDWLRLYLQHLKANAMRAESMKEADGGALATARFRVVVLRQGDRSGGNALGPSPVVD